MSAKGLFSEKPFPNGAGGEGSPVGQFLPLHQPLSCDKGCDGGIRKEGVIEVAGKYRFIGKVTPRKDAVEILTEGRSF